jgi:hypothetical protein
MPSKSPRPGRRGNPVSLAPLTPDQALAGLLQVKLKDLKKLEAKGEKKAGKKR